MTWKTLAQQHPAVAAKSFLLYRRGKVLLAAKTRTLVDENAENKLEKAEGSSFFLFNNIISGSKASFSGFPPQSSLVKRGFITYRQVQVDMTTTGVGGESHHSRSTLGFLRRNEAFVENYYTGQYPAAVAITAKLFTQAAARR